MQFPGDEGESQQANALFTSQGKVQLFGIADTAQHPFHLLGRHAGAVVLNGNALEEAFGVPIAASFVPERESDFHFLCFRLLNGISRILDKLAERLLRISANIGQTSKTPGPV